MSVAREERWSRIMKDLKQNDIEYLKNKIDFEISAGAEMHFIADFMHILRQRQVFVCGTDMARVHGNLVWCSNHFVTQSPHLKQTPKG